MQSVIARWACQSVTADARGRVRRSATVELGGVLRWALGTPKAWGNLAQGGGLAEPWESITKAPNSERAKESIRTQVIKRPFTLGDDNSRVRSPVLFRSFRAVRVWIWVPRVSPSLHAGLSSLAPSALQAFTAITSSARRSRSKRD